MNIPSPRPPSPLISNSTLPAWCVVALDGLIGSAVIKAEQLDVLSTQQLVEVAQIYVRASAAGVAFDPDEAIASARSRTRTQRYVERKATAAT